MTTKLLFENIKNTSQNKNAMALQRVNNAGRLISENFRKLGYEVPEINFRLVDGFKANNLDGPLFSDPIKGNIIFIDYDAIQDLANNKGAINFYIPHEIAHIITNANHEDLKFKTCIDKWNKNYPNMATIADPDDEDKYNQKYLPTYFKKTSWYDNLQFPKNISREEFLKSLEKRFADREWGK